MAIALWNVKTGQIVDLTNIKKVDTLAISNQQSAISNQQSAISNQPDYQVIDSESKQVLEQYQVVKQGDDLIIYNTADKSSYLFDDFWANAPLADTTTTPLANIETAEAGTVISTEVGTATATTATAGAGSAMSLGTLGWIGAGVAVIGGGALAMGGGGGGSDSGSTTQPQPNQPDPLQPTNHVGSILIQGQAKVGQTLTAKISDVDGVPSADKITYTWYVDDKVIADVKSDNLLLEQDYIGKTIKVQASYTDNQNYKESISTQIEIPQIQEVMATTSSDDNARGFANPNPVTLLNLPAGIQFIKGKNYSTNGGYLNIDENGKLHFYQTSVVHHDENSDIEEVNYTFNNVEVTENGASQEINVTVKSTVKDSIPIINIASEAKGYYGGNISGDIKYSFRSDGEDSITVSLNGGEAVTGIWNGSGYNFNLNGKILTVNEKTGHFVYDGLPQVGDNATYKFEFTIKDSDGDAVSASTTATILATPIATTSSSDNALNIPHLLSTIDNLPADAKFYIGSYTTSGGKLFVDKNGSATFIQTKAVNHNIVRNAKEVNFLFNDVLITLNKNGVPVTQRTNFLIKSNVEDSIPTITGNTIADTYVLGGNIGKIDFGADGKAAYKALTVKINENTSEDLIQQGTTNIYKSRHVTFDISTGEFIYTGISTDTFVKLTFTAQDNDSSTEIKEITITPQALDIKPTALNFNENSDAVVDLILPNITLDDNEKIILMYGNNQVINADIANSQIIIQKSTLEMSPDDTTDNFNFEGKIALTKTIGETIAYSQIAHSEVRIYQNTLENDGLHNTSKTTANSNDIIIIHGRNDGIENSNLTTNGGDDYIDIRGEYNGIYTHSNSTINAGDGNDMLTISGNNSGIINADVTDINAGGGNDTVKITSVENSGNATTTLDGGSDNDILVLAKNGSDYYSANLSNYTLFGTEQNANKTNIINFETIDLKNDVAGRIGAVTINIATPSADVHGTVKILGNSDDKVSFIDKTGWQYKAEVLNSVGHYYQYDYHGADNVEATILVESSIANSQNLMLI